MAIGTRSYARPYLANEGRLPQGIKWLLIVNTAIFLISYFSRDLQDFLVRYFALTPASVVPGMFLWQPVTYMFLHLGLFHILFNMLALWMFGNDLELTWGTRRFLQFYFFCGIGAGLVVTAAGWMASPCSTAALIFSAGALFMNVVSAFASATASAPV